MSDSVTSAASPPGPLLLLAVVSCGYIGNERISDATFSVIGKSPCMVSKAAIGFLQMERDGVMNTRTDTRCLQIILQPLSILYPYHVEVIDCSRPRWLEWEHHSIIPSKAILGRSRLCLDVHYSILIDDPVLVKNSCLDRIQPAVVTLYVMVVLLRLAMVAQHAYSLRHVRVVRRNCPSLTTSTRFLPG